jgi:hypothetical protein
LQCISLSRAAVYTPKLSLLPLAISLACTRDRHRPQKYSICLIYLLSKKYFFLSFLAFLPVFTPVFYQIFDIFGNLRAVARAAGAKKTDAGAPVV